MEQIGTHITYGGKCFSNSLLLLGLFKPGQLFRIAYGYGSLISQAGQ